MEKQNDEQFWNTGGDMLFYLDNMDAFIQQMGNRNNLHLYTTICFSRIKMIVKRFKETVNLSETMLKSKSKDELQKNIITKLFNIIEEIHNTNDFLSLIESVKLFSEIYYPYRLFATGKKDEQASMILVCWKTAINDIYNLAVEYHKKSFYLLFETFDSQ